MGPAGAADPFHCNSIDVAPDGDLLVSTRNMDSVFLIDRSTSAVLWKMGGSTYSKDGAAYVAVTGDPDGSFHRQHDARFLPDGSVSMFDDATGTEGVARAVVYSLDVAHGTATMTWQREGPTSSSGMGSFRTLADGSRIIGWGQLITGGHAFTELGADGQDVLDFDFPDGDVTYRAIKVPLAALDLGQLRRATGR
jgi:hypothetical protein